MKPCGTPTPILMMASNRALSTTVSTKATAPRMASVHRSGDVLNTLRNARPPITPAASRTIQPPHAG